MYGLDQAAPVPARLPRVSTRFHGETARLAHFDMSAFFHVLMFGCKILVTSMCIGTGMGAAAVFVNEDLD